MTWTKRDEDFLRRINKAEAAIQRVRELHRRTPQGWCWECVEHAYPCATIRALDGGAAEYGPDAELIRVVPLDALNAALDGAE